MGAPGRLAALLVVSLLAGCATDPAATPNVDEAVNVPALDLSNADFSDCAYTSFEEYYPGNTAPGTAPPGWEPSARPLSALGLVFWECADVDLAGQSWGPTLIMAEFSSSTRYYSECRASDEPFVYKPIHAVWTNRTDLADAIRTRLGRDVIVGTFEGGTTVANGVFTASWTWWTGGYDDSHIEVRQPFSQVTGTGDLGHVQWLWFNSTTVMTVDLGLGAPMNDHVFSGTGTADVSAPNLMSQDGIGSGAAVLAQAAVHVNGTGPVQRFRDLYCQDLIRDDD